MNPREISQGAKSCVVIDGACTTLVNPESGNARAFVLDYSYDSSEPDDTLGHYASNLTIFRDLGLPMLAKALEGVNTCLFTHGQSGSGKTYTMIGQENDPGLMPRLLESLFQVNSLKVEFFFFQLADPLDVSKRRSAATRSPSKRAFVRFSTIKFAISWSATIIHLAALRYK